MHDILIKTTVTEREVQRKSVKPVKGFQKAEPVGHLRSFIFIGEYALCVETDKIYNKQDIIVFENIDLS